MESEGRAFSTRAVCEAAGVTAPTLYHHFGDKDGLVDAVVTFGFSQYTVPEPALDADPLLALRRGWDRHVAFGLEHPAFYALLYGRARPGQPCAITGPATEMLTRLLDRVARDGVLAVPPADAAAQILAANVGVTLALIAQPDAERDLGLSDRVREAALAAVLTGSAVATEPGGAATGFGRPATVASAAIGLAAVLADDTGDLTAGELGLLRELLQRLATGSSEVRSGASRSA